MFFLVFNCHFSHKVDEMMFLKNLVIDDFIVFVNGSF